MIPIKTKKQVFIRSGNLCENCGSTWLLQCAHIIHRKMGGRHGEMKAIIDEPRNIALLCQACHDILDNRRHEPEKRIAILQQLKKKTRWYEWAKEHGIRDSRDGNNNSI